MKYAFAGDRDISCKILQFIIDRGYKPSMLLVTNSESTTHADRLVKISGLNNKDIIQGRQFRSTENILKLKNLKLDYIIGIHYPYIIPNEILLCPKVGFLNLHPAYLPYNKGWHTPTWAIIDETKYGATLHFMAETLDTGDIIHQKDLKVGIEDTANSLYQKVLKLEEEVFKEAFNDLLTLNPNRKKQTLIGTSHNKKDLFKINKIGLNEKVSTKELINKLRALTTNNLQESVFFVENDIKYAVQVKITKLD